MIELKNPLSCGLYETMAMRSVTGETLRPGGLRLTKRAADFLHICPGTKILDCGCGNGASLEFLHREYGADVTGIDPSSSMLKAAAVKGYSVKTGYGVSENICFKDGSFDIVFSECCLSHSKSIKASFMEFSRVLKINGYVVISDLYNFPCKEQLLPEKTVSADSGIFSAEQIKRFASCAGFRTILFEDHTRLLTHLACEIIFEYGSMEKFHEAASGENCDCSVIKSAGFKPGYCLMIAKK